MTGVRGWLVAAVLLLPAACTETADGAASAVVPCERFTPADAALLLEGEVVTVDPADLYLDIEGTTAGVGGDHRPSARAVLADRVCSYGLQGHGHEVVATYWLTTYPVGDPEGFHQEVAGDGVVPLARPGIAAAYRDRGLERSVSVLVAAPDDRQHEQGNAFDLIVSGAAVDREVLVEVAAAVTARH